MAINEQDLEVSVEDLSIENFCAVVPKENALKRIKYIYKPLSEYCGSDRAHFYRAFKEHYGFTAREMELISKDINNYSEPEIEESVNYDPTDEELELAL